MLPKTYLSPRGAVRYWISGENASGIPLVFLHGLTIDHTLFDRQIPFFERTHPVIVWDAPGHGASRPYADFTYANLAEDLHGILAQESCPRAVLIGQSMGGFAAQAFCRLYPAQAAGLIAIGSCPFGDVYTTRFDRWLLRQTGWMSRLYPYRLLVKLMARQCAHTQAAFDHARGVMSDLSKDEICRLMGMGFGAFTLEKQPVHISCPALLLVGEHDRTGKVRAYNRLWSARAGFPLVFVPDAAHNANYDNAQFINRAIADFLSALQ
ncbi:MAG: alpha/beta hydrolase [Clostridia bacterium]|nr:alpha/beta hydrolase [Clostridia bacterium]